MNTIPTNWLRSSTARRGEAVAIRDEAGRELTYAALLAEAGALAARIEAEAGHGAVCVLDLEPGIDHARSLHASMLAGRTFQTLRPALPAAERARALEGIADALLIDPDWLGTGVPEGASGSGAGGGDRLVPGGDPDPDAVATRLLTSGTSGPRRAVPLTYANHFWSAAASAHNLGVEPDDRWLCCLPTDHVGGLAILLRSAIYGTTAVVHSRFDAERVASALASAEATMISLVATQLRRLLAIGAEVERARVILVGGGPVPRSVLDAAFERGANVVQTYGLTEAASQVCTLSAADASTKRGSVGRPLLNVELGIDNGQLVVAGPMVSPEAGALLYTGDLGAFDEDGFLWIEGRTDDLIVSGGENVNPTIVEEVLRVHPAVAEAAVVGRPDEEWGESVTAVLVARGEAPSADALAEHCRAVLAAHEIPKRFEFVAELPRTKTGKLLRRELR